MKRTTLISALLAATVWGCDAPKPEPTERASASEAHETQTDQAPPAEHAGPGAAACAPIADLNAMDTRAPVPLQPMMAWHQKQNMMEHLVAIQRITDALSRDDWDGVAEAAKLIESSPQMKTMCQHMGAGAPGFTEMALAFHERADAIAPAARSQDARGVLRATSETLQACTSCHAAYRQDVVDAATWKERTGSDHSPGGGHHGH
jgi:hypothetical protein